MIGAHFGTRVRALIKSMEDYEWRGANFGLVVPVVGLVRLAALPAVPVSVGGHRQDLHLDLDVDRATAHGSRRVDVMGTRGRGWCIGMASP